MAQRLSVWLSVRDAIALHSAKSTGHTVAPAASDPTRSAAVHAAHQALSAELARVQHELSRATDAIRQRRAAPTDDHAAIARGVSQLWADQQRQMERAVHALREHTRKCLATTGSSNAQLALWDWRLAAIMAPRERELLQGMGPWLHQRAEALHAQSLLTQEPRERAWPQIFEDDVVRLLNAELELRLIPVMGMIDTLKAQCPCRAL